MTSRYELELITRQLLRAHPPPENAEEPPRAAVAIVLRQPSRDHDVELLFIRRSVREGDPWSGHIAFPGGRRDDEDASLLDTALRETHEEVGLDLREHGTLLLRLPDMAARAKGKRLSFSIAPFVFALARPDVSLVLDDREVAEAIWAPLGPLARGDRKTTHTIEVGGERYELPATLVGEHVLWGLTYGMMETLLAVVHDDPR